MTKKTIYIHIGTPKTGTTYVQSFLTANTEALEEKDVFYPIVGRRSEFNICANGGILHEEKPLEEILNKFSESKCLKMLLSEESLYIQMRNKNFYHNDKVRELLSNFDIKIIIYLRKSVEYLASLWQENIKYRLHLDLVDFAKLPHHKENLDSIYDIANTFGKENLIIKTFEKESWVNNNLIDDFLAILGIDDYTNFNNVKLARNEGMTRDLCDKILYVNKCLKMQCTNHDDYEIMRKIPIGTSKLKVINSIPDNIIEDITNEYYPLESKIAETLLDRKELYKSKYPSVYKTEREEYKYEISQEDKKELDYIVNTVLQRELINKQKEDIKNQERTINIETKTVTHQHTIIEQQQNMLEYLRRITPLI